VSRDDGILVSLNELPLIAAGFPSLLARSRTAIWVSAQRPSENPDAPAAGRQQHGCHLTLALGLLSKLRPYSAQSRIILAVCQTGARAVSNIDLLGAAMILTL
jgi:hypothetical protein